MMHARLCLFFILLLTGCSKLRRSPQVDAGPDAAAVAAAEAASAAASAAGTARAAAIASSQAAARAAALSRAREQLADIQWLVAHNVSANPARSGEGDVVSKCDTVEATTPRPGADPELVKTLDETKALCAFDVSLVTASEALDHMNFPVSQASRSLMCGIAQRELDRARKVKPRERKLLMLDVRRATTCM